MTYEMPDMTASNAEKDSPDFGLKMGKFIDSQWMPTSYKIHRDSIIALRKHMEGTVDVSHLKPMFSSQADAGHLAVNWKYMSDVPRFVVAITEGMNYDKYRTTVKGVDLQSQGNRSQFRREKLKAMYAKEEAKKISEMFGVDLMPKGFLPKSLEEMNLYMELEYKTAQEIALELGIQKVMDFNDWREVMNQLVEDACLTRYMIAAVQYHPTTALEFRRVLPEYFIHSRDPESMRDMRKAYYYGEVKTMTVSEIEKETRGQLSKEQVKSLASKFGKFYTDFRDFTGEEINNTVEAIKFCFKTNRYEMKKKKYYRNGGYKIINKEDYWVPPLAMKSEAYAIPYEVWYEGIYIPGTEIVLNYGLMDNMMRDTKTGQTRKALPPYVVYRLSTEPIAQRIADISDDLYTTRVKLRQFVLRMKPKGWAIDIDGLGGLDMPDGTKLTTLEQIKIATDEGILIYSGRSLIDGELNSRLPFYDMPDGSGRELGELLNVHNSLMQQLHEVTGINPQAVGQAPPARTSSAVYQGTIESSQRVVNHIFNGLLSIQQRVGETIVCRLQSAAVFGETKQIMDAILGEYTTDRIKELANIGHSQFVLNVTVAPSDEMRAELREDLNIALQNKLITPIDKIDISEIENIKLARQMIKIRQKANMEEAERQAQMQHKRMLEIEQAKRQGEMEVLKAKAEIDIMKSMSEMKGKAQIEAFLGELEMKKIGYKGRWDVAVAEAAANIKSKTETMKEDRKDERVREQGTIQSELIDQRKAGGKRVFTEPKMPDVGVPEGIEESFDIPLNQ
jgi:hypothetical protein